MDKELSNLIDSLVIDLNKTCPILQEPTWGSRIEWDISDFLIFDNKITYIRSSCGLEQENKYGPPNIICRECELLIELYQHRIDTLDRKFFSHDYVLNKLDNLELRVSKLEELSKKNREALDIQKALLFLD